MSLRNFFSVLCIGISYSQLIYFLRYERFFGLKNCIYFSFAFVETIVMKNFDALVQCVLEFCKIQNAWIVHLIEQISWICSRKAFNMFPDCNKSQLSVSYVSIFMPKNFCFVNILLLIAINTLINVAPCKNVSFKLPGAIFLTKHDKSIVVKV